VVSREGGKTFLGPDDQRVRKIRRPRGEEDWCSHLEKKKKRKGKELVVGRGITSGDHYGRKIGGWAREERSRARLEKEESP